jgi:hypothetical protein
MAAPEFSVDVFHSGYLPAGGRKVDAIVRVSSADGPGGEMPGVVLRVWTPQLATVRFLKQVAPAVEDLTARRSEAGRQAGDYPTGAWAAAESRDYHLCVEFDQPAQTGMEMQAARVNLIAGAASEPLTLGHGIIRVTWTDDMAVSVRIDKQVARYTGQAELAEAIAEGLDARNRGDEPAATASLGQALGLAGESGNQEAAKLLTELVEPAGQATPALDPGTAEAKVRRLIADEKASSGTFGRFTGRGRTVIVLALEEARMLNHDTIGTEHILLGLIRERQGVAAQALESLGIGLEAVRRQVVAVIGQGEQAPSGHIPFTPRAKKVLELSLREALQLGHDHIGPEHILLGLIREGGGVAAQVLVKLGADLNQVRQQVIQLLAGAPPAGVIGTGEVEFRLSAVEQRAGIAPATAELDWEIQQARIDRNTAVAAEDYERAASLRDRERELLADKASRHQQWAAGHQDLPSLAQLAEQVRQLSEEIEQLRRLLRQHGRRPDEGTV